MKTVILYYTFGGSTQKEAEQLAKELDAPAYRVKEARGRSLFSSFIPGGFQARKRKASAIEPLRVDLQAFDRIIIGCPVWAGFPAPAFNAMVQLLPGGKEVDLFFCSGGGDPQASEQGTKAMVAQRGCTVASLRNIATHIPPHKAKE